VDIARWTDFVTDSVLYEDVAADAIRRTVEAGGAETARHA
jgi:hypothetical protein